MPNYNELIALWKQGILLEERYKSECVNMSRLIAVRAKSYGKSAGGFDEQATMLYFKQQDTLAKAKKEWEEFNNAFDEKTKEIAESLRPLKGKFVTIKIEQENVAELYKLWEVGGRLMIMRLEEKP